MRAERVYDLIHENPRPTLLGRIKNSLSLGLVAGLLSAMWLILELLMLLFWEFLSPDDTIEKAVDFDYARYMQDKDSFGDHTFRVSTSNIEPKKDSYKSENAFYTTYETMEGKRRIKLTD